VLRVNTVSTCRGLVRSLAVCLLSSVITMATGFEGKWKLESSENFDNYMKAVGVGYLMAKLGSTAKPTVVIKKDGDQYTLRTETTFKNSEVSFKIDEEFQETTTDGRKCKTTFKFEGPNKLIQLQTGDVPSTIVRELTDENTLVCVCEAKDVVCKRVYKRHQGHD